MSHCSNQGIFCLLSCLLVSTVHSNATPLHKYHGGSDSTPGQHSKIQMEKKLNWHLPSLGKNKDAEPTERDLKILEEHYRVAEIMKASFRKQTEHHLLSQQTEINLLKEQQKAMELSKLCRGSQQCILKDQESAKKLCELAEAQDQHNRLVEEQKKLISDLNMKIKEKEEEIVQQKKAMSNTKTSQGRTMQLENELQHVTQSFNVIKTENEKLKESINHLRFKKAKYQYLIDKMHQKITHQKALTEKMHERITSMHNEKTDIQTDVLTIKDAAEKESKKYDIKIEELNRYLDHLKKQQQFNETKLFDRSSKERELQKMRQGKRLEEVKKHNQGIIDNYNSICERLRHIFGQQDVDLDKMAKRYMLNDMKMYSLFTYVNKLNNEVEEIKQDMKSSEDEILNLESCNKNLLDEQLVRQKELEEKLQNISETTEKYKIKYSEMSRELLLITSAAEDLVNNLGCDISSMEKKLGFETPTCQEKLQYFKILETEMDKLIQLHSYCALRDVAPGSLSSTTISSTLVASKVSCILGHKKISLPSMPKTIKVTDDTEILETEMDKLIQLHSYCALRDVAPGSLSSTTISSTLVPSMVSCILGHKKISLPSMPKTIKVTDDTAQARVVPAEISALSSHRKAAPPLQSGRRNQTVFTARKHRMSHCSNQGIFCLLSCLLVSTVHSNATPLHKYHGGSDSTPGQHSKIQMEKKLNWHLPSLGKNKDAEPTERDLKILEEHYRVAEIMKASFRKQTEHHLLSQQTEINLLKEQQKAMELSKLCRGSQQCILKDQENAKKLCELAEAQDQHNRLVEEQKKLISDLNMKIKEKEEEIVQQKKAMSNTKTSQGRTVQLENELQHVTQTFNVIKTENEKLKESINHLRFKKAKYQYLIDKMHQKITHQKALTENMQERITSMHNEKTDIQTDVLTIKDAAEKESKKYDIKIEELNRYLDHLKKQQQFNETKLFDRSSKERELQKMRQGKRLEEVKKHNQGIIDNYNSICERLRHIFGQQDVDLDKMAKRYMLNDMKMYSLFTYVNELNNEVEEIKQDIKSSEDEILNLESCNKNLLDEQLVRQKELEEKLQNISETTEKYKIKYSEMSRELLLITSAAEDLVNNLGCDISSMEKKLGFEKSTCQEKLQYFKILETEMDKLIQLHSYCALRDVAPGSLSSTTISSTLVASKVSCILGHKKISLPSMPKTIKVTDDTEILETEMDKLIQLHSYCALRDVAPGSLSSTTISSTLVPSKVSCILGHKKISLPSMPKTIKVTDDTEILETEMDKLIQLHSYCALRDVAPGSLSSTTISSTLVASKVSCILGHKKISLPSMPKKIKVTDDTVLGFKELREKVLNQAIFREKKTKTKRQMHSLKNMACGNIKRQYISNKMHRLKNMTCVNINK
ncbi:uncharacterized protein [Dendrobates tinctorius]|uniref:uncharacterized protein isoform X5 n=1 Tax=Dendrobates tinctorius TaxID=92724 RepID=UPI003CC93237